MSETVRVAVLTPYGESEQVGGVEVFNAGLRRVLSDLETFADGPPDGRASSGLRRVGLEAPVGALRAARTLLARHRKRPFDVILSNGLYGWPLSIARPNVPMIQVYHLTLAGLARDALSLPGARWTTGHVTALFDRVAGVGKYVVAVSQRVLREVESYYGLRGRCIPLAVDTDRFRPTPAVAARESLGLPRRGVVGMFVGRPDPTKGYDILLRVARRMPEVLFLVAGADGASEGNVRLLGRISHDDMPRWYSACDFFILPSLYEGFGLSVLEALSCDVPVVVSSAAWPFAESHESCGVVVQGRREEDFVGAVRFVLASREQLSPREFIIPRSNVEAFQAAWKALIRLVLDRHDGSAAPPKTV